jgi:hypothetical protein
MKVKFAKATFPGQDHVVLMVEHGSDGEKLFVKNVTLGETLTVEDDVGYKILSQYRGLFELVAEDKVVKEVTKK